MRETLFDLLWRNFLKIHGLIGGGIILAVLLWIFPPEIIVSLRIAIPILIILVLVIITLFAATYESFNSRQKILPSILYSRREPNQLLKCLLEPSELFSQNSLVSFYFYNDDDFEVLIGIGKVESIHENNGKIQIELQSYDPNQEDLINSLGNNDTTAKSKVLIKPNIPDIGKTNFI